MFDKQPSSYPTDRSRIAYVMNMLRGMAAQWVAALWEGTFNCYSSFVPEVPNIFDHPVQGQEAAICLLAF